MGDLCGGSGDRACFKKAKATSCKAAFFFLGPLSLKVRDGRLLKRASERRWVTALAESKRPAGVAKMSEVQFSEARIEQVSEPSAGEA